MNKKLSPISYIIENYPIKLSLDQENMIDLFDSTDVVILDSSVRASGITTAIELYLIWLLESSEDPLNILILDNYRNYSRFGQYLLRNSRSQNVPTPIEFKLRNNHTVLFKHGHYSSVDSMRGSVPPDLVVFPMTSGARTGDCIKYLEELLMLFQSYRGVRRYTHIPSPDMSFHTSVPEETFQHLKYKEYTGTRFIIDSPDPRWAFHTFSGEQREDHVVVYRPKASLLHFDNSDNGGGYYYTPYIPVNLKITNNTFIGP